MSLSASTIALFVFLAPGLIFRFSLFWLSPVRRPFLSAGTLYATIAVLLFAVTVHVVLVTLAFLVERALPLVGVHYLFPRLIEVQGSLLVLTGNTFLNLDTYVFQQPLMFVAYFVIAAVAAFLVALLVRLVADLNVAIGRILYGPIAPMIGTRKTTLITCFVVTKIQYNSKTLAYAGWPQEVSLKEGNNIDHVVLRNPLKFFLKLDQSIPNTSYTKARPISSEGNGDNYLYLDKADFQNVHFEAYYF